MGIYQAPVPIVMQVGNAPQILFMSTSDSLATITTAGYMNTNMLPGSTQVDANDVLLIAYDAASAYPHIGTMGWFNVSVSAGVITLTEQQSASGVNATLPTIVGHIATYSNTTGDITEDPATAISGGNIQAGLSGTAGYFASFPSAASKGSLRLTAVANTGDTLVTISNAAHGQASVYSIPDGGQATAEFIISDSSGTQHITSGSLEVDAGNIIAGISGTAGYLASFSGTAARGSLRLAAVANTGDTVTTISNAAMGQATVVSITDPGAATANFILSASGGTQTITSGNLTLATAGGVLQLGQSGAQGNLLMYPTTAARGSLAFQASENAGNFAIQINNASFGQATFLSIPDPLAAQGCFLVSALGAVDPNANLIWQSTTVGFAALAAGGSVGLYGSSGSKQYRIREIYLNGFGTNFSGGGGDRLGEVTDGTTSFSVIPAATMQALVNARWGSTDVAFPASVAINTATAAGANLVFKYTGGAADYTAGSLVITVCLERIA